MNNKKTIDVTFKKVQSVRENLYVQDELTRINFVKEFFVFVHPDFSRSHRVMIENVDDAAGPRIRRYFTEHVTNAGTRRDQNFTTAHPDL